MPEDRHSSARDPELITDPEERARREARNGIKLFDAVMEQVDYWLQPEHPFKLRLSAILGLHRITLEGLNSYAGNFRPASVEIKGSNHQPVGAHLVPEKIEEMCDYVNENWQQKSAIHLAAYVMWRLNWIHPFTDGNGRTTRAVAYLVLCVRLKMRLPGTNTITEQIAKAKKPYYEALEEADEHFTKGEIDLGAMEQYLGDLFANQLASVHDAATGN